MKIRLILIALLILAMPRVVAQQGKVGINTDEPTKKLDIKGNARIRKIPENDPKKDTDDIRDLVADYDGTVGEVKFDLETADMVVAKKTVEKEVTTQGVTKDIDLELSIDVKIPARTEADVFIFYSVPIAITKGNLNSNRFYGVQLFKSENGTEEEEKAAAVLFRVTKIITNPGKPEDKKNMNVVSAAKNFIEKIKNEDSQQDKIVTYSLKGIVWQAAAESTTYQFNTFEGTSTHDSDGKSVLTTQVYLRKLDDE